MASGCSRATSNAANPSGTVIQGNYVGLDRSGTLARGFTTGIYVGGTGTIVGGTAAGAGNVVAGNVSHNILDRALRDDRPGQLRRHQRGGHGGDPAGTSFGILVKAPNTVVGGTTAQARNVISGNFNGLFLSSSNQVAVTNVTVHGNYIGTDSTGLTAVPNAGSGVVVDAPGFTIGGTGAGMGNVIAGNRLGIYLLQTSWGPVSGVSVVGNRIGVNAAGNPLGNSDHGIRVDSGVSGAVVGGTGAGQANVIAHNGSRGVLLLGGTGTAVRGNRIDANGSLGIDNYDVPARRHQRRARRRHGHERPAELPGHHVEHALPGQSPAGAGHAGEHAEHHLHDRCLRQRRVRRR